MRLADGTHDDLDLEKMEKMLNQTDHGFIRKPTRLYREMHFGEELVLNSGTQSNDVERKLRRKSRQHVFVIDYSIVLVGAANIWSRGGCGRRFYGTFF